MAYRQKFITRKKILVFGKYKNKHISKVPYHYLYWMLNNLDLSIQEQSTIDRILLKKGEKEIQQQVVK